MVCDGDNYRINICWNWQIEREIIQRSKMCTSDPEKIGTSKGRVAASADSAKSEAN